MNHHIIKKQDKEEKNKNGWYLFKLFCKKKLKSVLKKLKKEKFKFDKK